jgi:hypothetical protein
MTSITRFSKIVPSRNPSSSMTDTTQFDDLDRIDHWTTNCFLYPAGFAMAFFANSASRFRSSRLAV